MGRLDGLLAKVEQKKEEQVEAEVERVDFRPDDIPEDVWQLIQENGRLATERLNEILASPKFLRLRAGDQAKLIGLAQERAYGKPKVNTTRGNARGARFTDVTAGELAELAHRTTLPEYKRSRLADIEDAEEL